MFGALGGLLHAVATVTFDVNHIVSGVAITLLGMGVTQYLSTLIFVPITGNPRQSPRIEGFETFSIQPLADWLAALEAQQRVLLSDASGLLGGIVSGPDPARRARVPARAGELLPAVALAVRAAAALVRGEPGGGRVARCGRVHATSTSR